jgi:hypothetical protein
VASYYYLVASLPLLRPEENPPMTTETFLETCRQSLGQSELDLVRNVSLVASTEEARQQNTFIRKWEALLTVVHKELNEQRARRLNLESDRYSQVGDRNPWVAEMVRAVIQAENPLQSELLLLQYYWRKIDELASGHVFDVEFLIAYHVKLQLLARRSLFTPLEGNSEFKRLFSNLQTIIKSI